MNAATFEDEKGGRDKASQYLSVYLFGLSVEMVASKGAENIDGSL